VLIEWCVASDADEIIVMTESGVNHSLTKLAPDKRFYYVANENCNCSECPYMKLNTSKSSAIACQSGTARGTLRRHHARALAPLERMLAVR